MSASRPIAVREHLQLSTLSIQPASIGSVNLTMESDRFVCVRETHGEQTQVVIIDLHDQNKVTRRFMNADSAIMHPSQKIIAVRANRELKVVNIETMQMVKEHVMEEDIVFWKWLSPSVIGLVTEGAVYHWSTTDALSYPQKIFDRHASLAGAEIINYHTTPDDRCMVLVGLCENSDPNAFPVKGAMQLHCREGKEGLALEGHAAAFADIKLDGNPNPTKLFISAVRTAAGAKLHIVEIDHDALNEPFNAKVVDVFFPADAVHDFPVALQVSQKYGIVYLVTKYGFIHVYDLETGTCIYTNRISSDTLLVTAEHEATSGIIGVNKKGQVLSVNVDENTVVPYMLSMLNNDELAVKMATRIGKPGAVDLFGQQVRQTLQSQDTGEAANANEPTVPSSADLIIGRGRHSEEEEEESGDDDDDVTQFVAQLREAANAVDEAVRTRNVEAMRYIQQSPFVERIRDLLEILKQEDIER